MRKVVVDTETTGLSPQQGDRIIEIAAVELINDLPTQKTFHSLVNPLRPIGTASQQIHGITDDMVANAPTFAEIVDDFLKFIGDSPLIIHNAPFDLKFINHELSLIQYKEIDPERVIDTLIIARNKFPGSPASLNALCRRFNISLAGREKHSALLDSQILAKVYIELIGGRQHSLLSYVTNPTSASPQPEPEQHISRRASRVRIIPSPEDIARHEAFLEKIQNPLWRQNK